MQFVCIIIIQNVMCLAPVTHLVITIKMEAKFRFYVDNMALFYILQQNFMKMTVF
jgi:hypothetical protein